MFVDDVNTSSRHRLNQILHTLKHVHNFDLKLDESSVDEITSIQNTSETLKTSIVKEGAFNNWHSNPNYAKHLLIVEATRLYLKEIAPRRRPRNLHEGQEPDKESKESKIGQWLINFANTASTEDEKLLSILNSFSRVGGELIEVGIPGGVQSISELIDSYESRANDAMNSSEDRRHAKDNIHALRVGLKLYNKHHAAPGNSDDMIITSPDEMDETATGVDTDSDFAQRFPELAALAQKYGIGSNETELPEDITDEGNKFSGALATARIAHKDKFNVGTKQYTVNESHMQSHDYQASMARSELYRNAKYAMDMLKMVRPDEDIEPWIAAALTKDALYLDKIYNYLDYYTKFEPGELPSQIEQPDFGALDEDDSDVEEASGGVARANLVEIFEYSVKLFHMIQPGDKLEGWVAMKLTTASEGISSAKHYLDYKNFERYASDHFDLAESRKYGLQEAVARKDFKLVADLIKRHSDAGARHHMAKHHADVFAKMDPKFNRGMFFTAANAREQHKDADAHPFSGKRSRRTVREAVDNAEQDLQQAETLIAAKSLSDDLQAMAEKVARMGVDELMPLVDTMKTQFGPEAADAYNQVMKAQLDTLLTATQEAKDQSDNAVIALQGGGVPGAGASDMENLPMAPELGAEDDGMGAPEGDDIDGLGTTPAAAGGEEPLGRAKKPVPGAVGDELAESRRRKLGEKKETDIWSGKTLAALRAKRKALMDKTTRTATEQADVKKIDAAISAKQKDKVDEAKKPMSAKQAAIFGGKKASAKPAAKADEKPDAKTTDKKADDKKPAAKSGNPFAKKKVAEAASPYTIGLREAKKEAGLDPAKPTDKLSKKMVTRGHSIARKLDKTDESIKRINGLLEKAAKGKVQLESKLAEHRTAFAKMVNEGKTTDVLVNGQGIEGDILQNRICEMQNMMGDLKTQINKLNATSRTKMKEAIEQERRAFRFAQVKSTSPWGVMVESATGGRDYKFFADQQARDYWVQLNGNIKAKLIGPEHFDRAASN